MALRYDDDEAVNSFLVKLGAVNSDDEVIDEVYPESDSDTDSFIDGDVKSKFFNKNEAPMESTLFNVRVDLMPASDKWSRIAQDIVMVLDVSSSMAEEDRLKGVKVLAGIIINRLNRKDRLSVIVYEGEVYRLCKLQKMTDLNKVEIQSLIDEIAAGGGSNVKGGLREAMKVIDDRKFTRGRGCAIVLMSDGDLHHADGSITQTYSVPVYTIHYGHQPESQVLQNIASNSNGGTFTFVDTEETETSKNFIQTVSNVVAGQMDRLVVAEDLHLTITNIESTIKKVSAGNFPQCWDESSVTITFGALHCKEKFSVSVDLLLDEVSKSRGTDVVEFSYCYHDRGKIPYLVLFGGRDGGPGLILRDTYFLLVSTRPKTFPVELVAASDNRLG